MDKPTLYISCGLPGAGKSTFLKANKKEDEIIVSRDEIRYSLLREKDAYFQHELKVFDLFIQQIGEGLSSGKNVYADATHLNGRSRSKLMGRLNEAFPNLKYNIEVIYFDVPLYICLERNNQRTGRARVIEDAIIHMSNILEKPYPDYAKHLWIIDEDGIVYKEW